MTWKPSIHAFCKLIHSVLTDWNRRFVEGVQSNISKSTIDHMGRTKTPVKKNTMSILRNNTGKQKTTYSPVKKESRRIHDVSKGTAQSPLIYKCVSKYPS